MEKTKSEISIHEETEVMELNFDYQGSLIRNSTDEAEELDSSEVIAQIELIQDELIKLEESILKTRAKSALCDTELAAMLDPPEITEQTKQTELAFCACEEELQEPEAKD